MFDAIKIKEEPVDNDLEEVSGRKYEPYSKDKFLQVKLEPLDQDVLKRYDEYIPLQKSFFSVLIICA